MNSWVNLIKELRIRPDKVNPKNSERDKRDHEAGKKFADATGISKVMGMFVAWAEVHKKAFLIIVFGFVLTLFTINLVRLIKAYNNGAATPRPVVIERVDSLLANPRHSINK